LEKKNFHLMTVKESTIPGAGSGAFATQFIPINTDLGRYYGHASSLPPKDGSYTWRIDGTYIDANYKCETENIGEIWCTTNPLKYINAPKNENEKQLVNTIMKTKEDENGNALPHYYTTKDIDVGEELFIDYGDEYWPYVTDDTPTNSTSPAPINHSPSTAIGLSGSFMNSPSPIDIGSDADDLAMQAGITSMPTLVGNEVTSPGYGSDDGPHFSGPIVSVNSILAGQ